MFGMFGTDDPRKMALQSVGMQMLMGGDPNQALQNLPQMLMEAKKLQYAREQDAKAMALQETQLGIEKERFQLMKDQDLRAAQDAEGKRAAGKAFSESLMMPNGFTGADIGSMVPGPGSQIPPGVQQGPPAGMSSMMPPQKQKMAGGPAPQVTSDFKGDIAVPMGEENNPITQRLQNMPRSMIRALQADPGTAAELMAPAMQQGLTDAVAPKGDRNPANVINLRMPDGKVQAFNTSNPTQLWQAENAMAAGAVEVAAESGGGSNFKPVTLTNGQEIKSFNVETPEGAMAADKAMSEGWYEAPDKTIVDKGEDPMAPLNKPYLDEIVASRDEAAKAAKARDSAIRAGVLVMNANTYAGTGAPLLNAFLKAGQDFFGVFEEKDFSSGILSETLRKSMIADLRKSQEKDSNFSSKDLDFLIGQTVGVADGREAMARFMAIKSLEADWAEQKNDFLYGEIETGKKPREALKAWSEIHKKNFRKFFSEEEQQKKMAIFKEGAEDPTAIQEILQGVQGVEEQGAAPATPVAPAAPAAEQTPTPSPTGRTMRNVVSPSDPAEVPAVSSDAEREKLEPGTLYFDEATKQFRRAR